jgi:Helicase conserved C-terminal domain
MASAQENPDIATAMETLNDPQFLGEAKLESYSPKFAAILERILDDKNVGLHLLYSSFRTLEGIGILRLVLLQNGFAEFKLVKTADGEWDIDEGEDGADAGKPRFALYTGTETAEEKEIIRNVYNGGWDMIPPNIAKKLEERDPDGKKNVMGAVIKVLMITASGAEGINLKNTRYVHIVEPYWNMVRVDQVVGRARRICSHEELPPELRTVEVFIYLSVFSEKQKTDRNYIDLMNQDTSRFDESVPVTTDETLYEISLQKNRINQRILEVVKQSSVDCALYNPSDKPGSNQVCYGANLKNVTTNDFISYPSIELDAQVKERTVVQRTKVAYRDVTIQGTKYHLNEATQEIYDHPTYMRAKKSGETETMIPVGKLVKEGRGYKIVKP